MSKTACACAVGTIGLAVLALRACASVTCIEVNGDGKAAFAKSLRRLPEDVQAVPCHYCVAHAGSLSAAEMREADVIILDPPRKGLEAALVDHLMHAEPAPGLLAVQKTARTQGSGGGSGAQTLTKAYGSATQLQSNCADASHTQSGQHLIYLSCGLPALIQDLQRLVDQGPWRIVHAEGFLFFPGTDAIETLVVMERG
jgi:23S rRNA (uracil1939-C5)-methyltransferase